MQEVKAYVRRSHVNQVVDALRQVGAPGITLVEIHPVGYGYEPNYFAPGYEDVFRRYGHLQVVKLEIVCTDQDVERLVQAIVDAGQTGLKGDGIIFVSDVSRAIRIRDDVSGEEILARTI